MRGLRRRIIVGMMLAAGVLCAGAGCGQEEDPRPARWSYIWATIIQPNCTTSGCHSKHTATFGLQLDTPEGAYVDLMGRATPTELCPSFVCVGQPDRSRLLYLLRGDRVAKRMPPDNPLPDPDIALIERWILAGAPND